LHGAWPVQGLEPEPVPVLGLEPEPVLGLEPVLEPALDGCTYSHPYPLLFLSSPVRLVARLLLATSLLPHQKTQMLILTRKTG
jgi:hypothetical protein